MVALFLRRLREVVNKEDVVKVDDFIKPYIQLISKKTVSVDQLLVLDDFSLSVLIDHFSRESKLDETLADLAKRIMSRDLFKIVPVRPERISEFLHREDAYSRLYERIEKYAPGKAESYLVVDKWKFQMLGHSERGYSYLINESREAIALKDHPFFREMYEEGSEIVRLFTLKEAVDEVADVIGK
jgi:hypothetical protein